MFVAAAVAGDAGDWQVHGEGLADFVVPAGFAQFVDEDGVGATEFVGVFLLYFAEDAYAPRPGPGNGWRTTSLGASLDFC